MKKQALKNFTVFSLLLMLTAVSVAAQSERTKVIIPFSFIVGEKTFPAGEYTVEPSRRDFDKVWLVQSKESDTSAFFTTIPVRANQTQEEAKLIFRRYGDQYFLWQIWTPGGDTGRELVMPRLERQLAKNGIQRETVVVTVGTYLE